VEILAEDWPNIVPHGGVNDAIVNEHYSFIARSALLIIDFPAFDIEKSPRSSPGLSRIGGCNDVHHRADREGDGYNCAHSGKTETTVWHVVSLL
jgi:hypothetical protein